MSTSSTSTSICNRGYGLGHSWRWRVGPVSCSRLPPIYWISLQAQHEPSGLAAPPPATSPTPHQHQFHPQARLLPCHIPHQGLNEGPQKDQTNTAPGADNISGQILRHCEPSLPKWWKPWKELSKSTSSPWPIHSSAHFNLHSRQTEVSMMPKPSSLTPSTKHLELPNTSARLLLCY